MRRVLEVVVGRYEIYGLDANGNVTFKAPLARYLAGGVFDLDPVTWQDVAIPVQHLLGSSNALYAVGIQEMSGVNGWTSDWIYLDDVRFEYRAPTGNILLYNGSLASAWNADGSWNATVNLANPSPVHGSANSIAVTYSAAWGGLYMQTATPVNVLDVRTVSFWIHGGAAGGQKIEVWLRDGSNVASPHVAISPPSANTWSLVEIPLADFGNPTTISAIVWQDTSGGAQATYYLSDITLSTSPPTPPPPPPPQVGPALSVDASAGIHPISPYIYGMNFANEAVAAAVRLPVQRWGGNATTRYNWQTDTSNRASDWYFENIPEDNANPAALPNGSATDKFIEQNQRTGTASLLTVPLIGWTPKARDYSCSYSVTKYGAQQSVDPWRPDCGNGRYPDGTVMSGNDPLDTSTAIEAGFVTGWINHMTTTYGGVQFYNLDNEPMLWNSTHRDVHPNPVTYDELRDRTVTYASAIKAADPKAATLGPVVWGWCAYFYSAADGCYPGADRQAHGNIDFIEWYLQQMRAYEQQQGTRILDYLDVHSYPQMNGVYSDSLGSATVQTARLRSTRQLWDTSYTDESWIAQPVYLIPRMKQWTANNYPGTKLSISEYSWGALGYLNGALAQADALGIFGREGLDLATLWGTPTDANAPGIFAFRMYRNYDGAGGAFGETSVHAASSDQDKLALYAARRTADNALTLMVVNKTGQTLTSTLALTGFHATGTAEVYRYSSADLTKIVRQVDQTIAVDGFTADYPPNSITLYVAPVAVDTFTVAFNSNGGSTVPGQSVVAGGTATKPADPTLPGYNFAGWYSDAGLTTIFNFATPITGTITLYARWVPQPVITGFTPLFGPPGSKVTLAGINLGGATAVTFNGVSAVIVTNTATSTAVTVPTGALSGPIGITTAAGTANSATDYIVTPTVTAFTPVSGSVGATVVITGTNFTHVTAVKFNATAATLFTVDSTTQITAVVPVGATTGKISVTTGGVATGSSAGNFTITLPPTITSFTPAFGLTGSRVTITGTNLTGATGVTINGVSAAIVTNTATTISATVPAGASSGSIRVTTAAGTAISTATYTVTPTVSALTPVSGPVGASVVITGTNYTNVTAVKFNTTAATVFSVDSATQITAVVPAGATTGKISVTAGGVATGSSAGNFTVILPPTITGFTPAFGLAGSRVTITGTNLTGATAVTMNGIPAVIVTNTATSLSVTVPTGNVNGWVRVTTLAGTATSATGYTATPTVASFTPVSGPVGTTVVITGTNYTNVTAVKFNTTAATAFTVDSATQITATVPAGATTGKISITSGGVATGSSTGNYTVILPPTITSFTPVTGLAGSRVTLTGTNLTGAIAVTMNGIPVVIVTNTATSLSFTVPDGNVNGSIKVTTPAGIVTSATPFTVPLPTITAFAPTAGGGIGTGVTLTGTNFTGATAVTFNGKSAPFVVISATSIATTVPTGATSGPVGVTTPGGTATSAAFTVGATAALPKVTSFTPATGGLGASVTITGTNFVGSTAVTFGSTPAKVFTVLSNSSLLTAVPPGAVTGTISVVTPNGTATSTAVFTVGATPVIPTITSFTPLTGRVGTLVTVTGTNLGGVTSATIGGVAASVQRVSATSLKLTVSAGAATGPVIVTTDGGVGGSTGTFTVTP